jgi:hypothetical protein
VGVKLGPSYEGRNIGVLESWLLRRIFGAKREEVPGN